MEYSTSIISQPSSRVSTAHHVCRGTYRGYDERRMFQGVGGILEYIVIVDITRMMMKSTRVTFTFFNSHSLLPLLLQRWLSPRINQIDRHVSFHTLCYRDHCSVSVGHHGSEEWNIDYDMNKNHLSPPDELDNRLSWKLSPLLISFSCFAYPQFILLSLCYFCFAVFLPTKLHFTVRESAIWYGHSLSNSSSSSATRSNLNLNPKAPFDWQPQLPSIASPLNARSYWHNFPLPMIRASCKCCVWLGWSLCVDDDDGDGCCWSRRRPLLWKFQRCKGKVIQFHN